MPKQPAVKELSIPARFGARRRGVDDQLSRLAKTARDAVARAGKDADKVMDALADFHDGWWEQEADECESAVKDFFMALVAASGADVDALDAWEEVHLGLYGLEGIGDEQVADTISELLDVDGDEAGRMVEDFVEGVGGGLVRDGRAYIPGFAAFTVEDPPSEEPEPGDIQVLVRVDPSFEQRLQRARAGEEDEEEADEAPRPGTGAVVEALLEAFLNEWVVELQGLGALACQWEEGPELVFKPAWELREALASSGTGAEE
ncbi:MAG: hypothetical protein HY904_15620 [Deltaproteobacteria bacterium]|nr:hypothetical protein [Deltaproteobacteria bacterium]